MVTHTNPVHMATSISKIPPEICDIAPEEHKLLHRALAEWYNMAVFSDEQVAQVKQPFQRWLVETAWSKQHDKLRVLCVQSDPTVPA